MTHFQARCSPLSYCLKVHSLTIKGLPSLFSSLPSNVPMSQGMLPYCKGIFWPPAIYFGSQAGLQDYLRRHVSLPHLKVCSLTISVQISLVLSCLVLSCLVLSCLVSSCLVLSCLVLSCLVLSCLVLSCLVLSPLLSSPLLSSPSSRRPPHHTHSAFDIAPTAPTLTTFTFALLSPDERHHPHRPLWSFPHMRWAFHAVAGTAQAL